MLRLTINRTPWTAFRDALAAREPFATSGNLRGESGAGWTGYLPDRFAAIYRARFSFIDYTVYSYATPIAWHDIEHGWYLPEVRYSVTTSKAQSCIGAAVYALQEDSPICNVAE